MEDTSGSPHFSALSTRPCPSGTMPVSTTFLLDTKAFLVAWGECTHHSFKRQFVKVQANVLLFLI